MYRSLDSGLKTSCKFKATNRQTKKHEMAAFFFYLSPAAQRRLAKSRKYTVVRSTAPSSSCETTTFFSFLI